MKLSLITLCYQRYDRVILHREITTCGDCKPEMLRLGITTLVRVAIIYRCGNDASERKLWQH